MERAAAAKVEAQTAERPAAAVVVAARPVAPLEVAVAEGETAAVRVAAAYLAAVGMVEAARVVVETVEVAAAVAADLDRKPLWCCIHVVWSGRTEYPAQTLAARKAQTKLLR